MPIPSALTPSLAAALLARLRPWAWVLAMVLAGAGGVPSPTAAGDSPAGAVVRGVPLAPRGGVSRLAERDARGLLAADGLSLRLALRRGDGAARGPRGPDPSERPALPLRALPPPAGALPVLLPRPSSGPPHRALAAARDGTVSAASNGVPPPPLA